MNDFINLESGKAIRKWADARYLTIPPDTYSQLMTTKEFLEYHPPTAESKKASGRQIIYTIKHSLGLSDGWTLVRIERAILAKDAEDALEQYIFDSDSLCMVGEEDESLAVIIRDNYKHEPQRIKVYRASSQDMSPDELARLE